MFIVLIFLKAASGGNKTVGAVGWEEGLMLDMAKGWEAGTPVALWDTLRVSGHSRCKALHLPGKVWRVWQLWDRA